MSLLQTYRPNLPTFNEFAFLGPILEHRRSAEMNERAQALSFGLPLLKTIEDAADEVLVGRASTADDDARLVGVAGNELAVGERAYDWDRAGCLDGGNVVWVAHEGRVGEVRMGLLERGED